MKVLFVTSEAAPFAASGGLGDVMGSLPAALAEDGTEVNVILPLYGSVAEEYRCRMEVDSDLFFRLSWRETGARVFRLNRNGVTYYFVENHRYFMRDSMYAQGDDAERFSFFCHAVIAWMLADEKNIPDIFHANDWQTALGVILLKTEYADVDRLRGIKTVLTVHNIEYQGRFDPAIMGDIFGLNGKYYPTVSFDGAINLLKGAMVCADRVTTVSPNYAAELRHDFFAYGLSGVVRSVENKFCGILNGIDGEEFSPSNGKDLYLSYGTVDRTEGKRYNKKELSRELGWDDRPDIPLFIVVSRLVRAKGQDLFLRIADEFLSMPVRLAVLGTGDPFFENAFDSLARRRENCRVMLRFDRTMSRKMYAAGDYLIMPSKTEPCGLSQMIACAYGAVPIVRATGGLYDTVRPYGAPDANGFTFNNYNAHELLYTLQKAVRLYRESPSEYAGLQLHAMQSDFSWKPSAAGYRSLYRDLLGG